MPVRLTQFVSPPTLFVVLTATGDCPAVIRGGGSSRSAASTVRARPSLDKSGRLVVVAAAADSVSRPSRHREYHADHQEDDPDDQANMGVGEGGDEGREEQPEDDKDDSESDHDVT